MYVGVTVDERSEFCKEKFANNREGCNVLTATDLAHNKHSVCGSARGSFEYVVCSPLTPCIILWTQADKNKHVTID